MSKNKWIILDWARNHKFQDKTFNSISSAADYLSEQVDIIYPETKDNDELHNDCMAEYQFITEKEFKS